MRHSLFLILESAAPILQYVAPIVDHLFLSCGSLLSTHRGSWIQHGDDVDFTAVIVGTGRFEDLLVRLYKMRGFWESTCALRVLLFGSNGRQCTMKLAAHVDPNISVSKQAVARST